MRKIVLFVLLIFPFLETQAAYYRKDLMLSNYIEQSVFDLKEISQTNFEASLPLQKIVKKMTRISEHYELLNEQVLNITLSDVKRLRHPLLYAHENLFERILMTIEIETNNLRLYDLNENAQNKWDQIITQLEIWIRDQKIILDSIEQTIKKNET